MGSWALGCPLRQRFGNHRWRGHGTDSPCVPRAGGRALGAERARLCNLRPPCYRGSHSTRTLRSTQPGGSCIGGPPLSPAGGGGRIPPPDPCRTGTRPCLHRPPGEGLGWARGPGVGGRAAPWASRVLLLEVGAHPPTPASQSATGEHVLGLGLACAVVWGPAASWCCGRAWIGRGTVLM